MLLHDNEKLKIQQLATWNNWAKKVVVVDTPSELEMGKFVTFIFVCLFPCVCCLTKGNYRNNFVVYSFTCMSSCRYLFPCRFAANLSPKIVARNSRFSFNILIILSSGHIQLWMFFQRFFQLLTVCVVRWESNSIQCLSSQSPSCTSLVELISERGKSWNKIWFSVPADKIHRLSVFSCS